MVKIRLPQLEQTHSPPSLSALPLGSTAIAFTGEPQSELLDPLTGELVPFADIDGLISAYERVKAMNDRCYAVMCKIRELLADRAEGDATTRRVAGKNRRAKLTMPGVKFEQATLKQLWQEYPQIAERFLQISELSVKMREYSKLENTTSDQDDFMRFRDALTAANRGRVGLPTISIEE